MSEERSLYGRSRVIDSSDMTSADFERIINCADEAKKELVDVGIRYLSRLHGNRLFANDGSWSFVGFCDNDDALVPGRNFVIRFSPAWGSDDDDVETFFVPSCVLDDFEVGVSVAVQARYDKERERALKKKEMEKVKELAERHLYLRLKAKFEKEGDSNE